MDLDRVTFGLALMLAPSIVSPFFSALYGMLLGAIVPSLILGGAGVLLARDGLRRGAAQPA